MLEDDDVKYEHARIVLTYHQTNNLVIDDEAGRHLILIVTITPGLSLDALPCAPTNFTQTRNILYGCRERMKQSIEEKALTATVQPSEEMN